VRASRSPVSCARSCAWRAGLAGRSAAGQPAASQPDRHLPRCLGHHRRGPGCDPRTAAAWALARCQGPGRGHPRRDHRVPPRAAHCYLERCARPGSGFARRRPSQSWR